MNESTLIHWLAAETEKLELMKAFGTPNQDMTAVDIGLHVTWIWGSSCAGYKELANAMRTVVAERWLDLRNETIARQESIVTDLRRKVVAASEAWGVKA